ncbi:MAG: hypothetical protein ABI862_08005 [Ilumatobacteraceae bacterium]
MIDPLLSTPVPPSAAERLAALRAPSKKRAKPAHTSKVLSAGVSATALLGMVAVMGWQSGTGTAQSTAPVAPVAPVAQAVVPVAPALPVIATPAPTMPPVVVETTIAPSVPVAVAPVPVPVTAAPVVIPVAVPVAQPPVQRAAPAASNTTTKTSG